MDFNAIRKEVKDIPFDTLRTDADNYFEAVIIKSELKKLTEWLERFFGLPVFPSKNRLSFQARETIDGFGGVMPGQTLYFWNQGVDTIFAMLWPWQDGQHTTLKIVKKE